MTSDWPLSPWQVWWAQYDEPAVGHEMQGRRPCVVVGSDLYCRMPNGMALVVPVTTTLRPRLLHRVELTSPGTGLKRASWVRTEDLHAISVERLGSHPIGVVSAEESRQIMHWIHRFLARPM